MSTNASQVVRGKVDARSRKTSRRPVEQAGSDHPAGRASSAPALGIQTAHNIRGIAVRAIVADALSQPFVLSGSMPRSRDAEVATLARMSTIAGLLGLKNIPEGLSPEELIRYAERNSGAFQS